jgi:hypothetical protein
MHAPATRLPVGDTAVTKSVFIDLLDPAFGLKAGIAEKLEGLAWGHDLVDGRHQLYVVSDNDLNPAQDTHLYAFAVTDAVADVQHQVLPGPLLPPGQVVKLTR